MTLPPCIQDCGFLTEIGPPPDLIVNLPPPPVPAFLQNSADILLATNGSCDFCTWAHGTEIPFIEVSRKGRALDDATYFIAISSCVGLVIMSILIVVVIFRCKEAKVKPVPDMCGKRLAPRNLLSDISDTTLYVNNGADNSMHRGTNSCQPKVLWSGLGNMETNPYVLHHQPISSEEPELLSQYEYIDYGSVGHTYTYPAEVVRIMNDNESQNRTRSTEASFENCGFVDTENHATSF